jgi:hypothetical protein
MNAWDHLPNAKHIDWVLASLKQYPEIWDAAHSETWGAARIAAQNAALDAALRAAWSAARHAAWDATWNAAIDAAYDAAQSSRASCDAAYDAILALVAYDDCAHLLDMPSDRLKIWAVLTEQTAAALLLPAVIAHEQIRELETV